MCGANNIDLETLRETVSDKYALYNIKEFLRCLKSSGKKKVNILDLLFEFKYPTRQIERIMEKLEKEGLVKEGF